MTLRYTVDRDKRRPRIFTPRLKKIPCKGGMKCSRCNEEVYWVYGDPEILKGYFCIDCMIILTDAIVDATGIHARSYHA